MKTEHADAFMLEEHKRNWKSKSSRNVMGNLEFPFCNILLKYSLDSCIYISQTNFLIFCWQSWILLDPNWWLSSIILAWVHISVQVHGRDGSISGESVTQKQFCKCETQVCFSVVSLSSWFVLTLSALLLCFPNLHHIFIKRKKFKNLPV